MVSLRREILDLDYPRDLLAIRQPSPWANSEDWGSSTIDGSTLDASNETILPASASSLRLAAFLLQCSVRTFTSILCLAGETALAKPQIVNDDCTLLTSTTASFPLNTDPISG